MDYFSHVLATFLDLDRGTVDRGTVYAGSENSWIWSKIFTFMFQRWTKVLQVWNDMGWVINDIIFIFGWTIQFPLLEEHCDLSDRRVLVLVA